MQRFRDTKYLVSEDGRVFNEKSGRFRKPNTSGRYLVVNLSINGVIKNHLIHRLVAEVYIENPKKKPQVNHIDGDKLNNHVSNLEWCTNSENQKHAYKKGMQSPQTGSNHGQSKLTEQQVREILSLKGKKSQGEIAQIYGVSRQNIGDIHNRKLWKHISKKQGTQQP